MSAATDNLATAITGLTANETALVSAVNAAVTSLDNLASKLGASSDPAIQAAADSINAISTTLGASQANLSAAVAKDDPAPAA